MNISHFLHDKLKHLKKSSLYELIDKLYTAKSDKNPMTHYMNDELDSETLFYLLRNPSLFVSQSLYYDFVQRYFPSFVERHPQLTQSLVQMYLANQYRKRYERQNQRMYELNFKRVSDEINRNRRNKRLPDNLNVTVQLNNILYDTAKRMTSEHRRQLDYHLNRIQKDLDKIHEEGLIKNADIKNNPEIQKLRKKHQQQIQRQNKRIEKNKENRVKWMTERLQENPHKYKVWQQTPNPKTRHTETNGQKVKLEEQFIVINDKTGDIDYVDYPGDWTCSPSNKENCLCNITFTNNPTGYKPRKKLLSECTQLSEDIKISEKIRKALSKNRTHHKFENINNYVSQKQIDTIFDRIKDQFPDEFSEQSIKEIIKMQQAFKKDANEHGCVVNLNNGKIYNTLDGKHSDVTISYSGIDDMANLASIHNHPNHGFNAPSDTDIDNMLHNSNEKYCIVLSENKIWIVKNKYHNIDLREKDNYPLCVDCLNIVKGVRKIFENNKVKMLDDTNSIENINSTVDKEINSVFDELNVYSKIIKV